MATPALQQQQGTGEARPAEVRGVGTSPSGAPRPPSHRLRFVIGVALGAAVAVGLSYSLLSRARAEAVSTREQHKAIVSTLSLADLVVRAGGTGEAVRTAVAAWQQKAPAGTQARVVIFSGL